MIVHVAFLSWGDCPFGLSVCVCVWSLFCVDGRSGGDPRVICGRVYDIVEFMSIMGIRSGACQSTSDVGRLGDFGKKMNQVN